MRLPLIGTEYEKIKYCAASGAIAVFSASLKDGMLSACLCSLCSSLHWRKYHFRSRLLMRVRSRSKLAYH